MKVKSEKYVAVHHLRGEGVPTPKNIMKLILTNEYDEYFTYFPEDKPLFLPYINHYGQMIVDVLKVWETHKHIEDQKSFALKVKDSLFQGLLFGAKAKKSDPVTLFKDLDIGKRLRMLTSYVETRHD